MKTVLQICLVLFVAVSCSSGQNVGNLRDAINSCLNLNKQTGSLCPFFDSNDSCLRSLAPSNEEGQNWVKTAIEFNQEQKNRCPGLDNAETCIGFVAEKCMEMVRTSIAVGDQMVCSYLPQAKDCLMKANGSCTAMIKEIEYYTDMLVNVTSQCEAGHWKHGPCSPSAVLDCAYTVYSDIKSISRTSVEYMCQETDVASAKNCLDQLKSSCNTQFQQDTIMAALRTLKTTCKSTS